MSEESVDSTQNFCNELNKRQIMPMELMQARSHHRFNDVAEKCFYELQQVKIAVRKTALYVRERQSEIGKKIIHIIINPFTDYIFSSLKC
jgi:hypothetical protein